MVSSFFSSSGCLPFSPAILRAIARTLFLYHLLPSVRYEAMGALTDMSSLVDGVDRVAQALPFSSAIARIQRGEPVGESAAENE